MLTRYDVTTEEKGDYVHVRIAGTGHNIKAFMSAIQEGMELCLASQHKKLLLEDAITEDWPPIMLTNLIEEATKTELVNLFIVVFISNPVRHFNYYYGASIAKKSSLNIDVSNNYKDAIQKIKNTE